MKQILRKDQYAARLWLITAHQLSGVLEEGGTSSTLLCHIMEVQLHRDHGPIPRALIRLGAPEGAVAVGGELLLRQVAQHAAALVEVHQPTAAEAGRQMGPQPQFSDSEKGNPFWGRPFLVGQPPKNMGKIIGATQLSSTSKSHPLSSGLSTMARCPSRAMGSRTWRPPPMFSKAGVKPFWLMQVMSSAQSSSSSTPVLGF